jgi:acyl carrier protein
MGLDSVELIMEVEKAFDIRIPDQEAEKATTVGELYETVWRHIKHDHDGRCTSQMLFYLIRRKLIEKIGLNRSDVTIEANPDQLFETGQKRLIYAQISEEMQLEFPPLVLRRPWDNSLALTIYLVNFKDYSGWIFVLNLIPIILLMEISRYFDPLRTRVPHQNMRNFIQDVLKLNYPKIKGVNGITRKEMEQVIDLIIIDKLGVDPSEVSPEKSFTDDLGVD